MKVKIQSVHFSADEKLVEFVEKRIAKLVKFNDQIVGSEVFLKLENSGKIKDKISEIKLSLPGTVIFVKESKKTFESSIDSACDSLKRQLIKHKERIRA